MKKKESIPYEDDGKTIADMNVEGMPWYRPRQTTDAKPGDVPELTEKEAKYFVWGALKAGLLVAALFGGTAFLFILFLDVIVFKN